MLYVIGVWFVWLIVSVFWISFPLNIFNRGGTASLRYLLSLLAVLSTGIYAKVYRYRTSRNPVKRQQLKWIVFVVAIGILTGIVVNLLITFLELLHPAAGTNLIVDMVTQTLSVLPSLRFPSR